MESACSPFTALQDASSVISFFSHLAYRCPVPSGPEGLSESECLTTPLGWVLTEVTQPSQRATDQSR